MRTSTIRIGLLQAEFKQYAVYESQINEPYFKMGLSYGRVQRFYRIIFRKLFGQTNPRIFNVLQQIVSIRELDPKETLNLKPKSET